MNITELSRKAYQSAKRKGLYDKEQPLEHYLMLVIDEISECHKASLGGREAKVEDFKNRVKGFENPKDTLASAEWSHWFEQYVHQTTPDELADICIMCFSVLGYWMSVGWILEAAILKTTFTFNRNPPELPQNIPDLLIGLSEHTAKGDIGYVVLCVMKYCEANNIDLEWHVEQKMKYNELRER